MKLKELLRENPELRVVGSKQTEITGISIDSRTTAPGNLFVALQGTSQDGTEFIPQAIEFGAAALVVPIYNPFIKIPQILSDHPQALLARLSAIYYRRASQSLWVAGVTGSKGKTTTCYLLRHLLANLGKPCGLISTVEMIIGDRHIPSSLTTHDAVTNQKILREMADSGCAAAVLEVSSHGLAQQRVDEIKFDIALFTNLFPDHLDYHQTIEAYAAEKRKLFERAPLGIYCADSPWASFMQQDRKGISFGLEKQADVMARDLIFDEKGACFSVENERFSIPLMGRFNIYNTLGAVAVGLFLGASLPKLAEIFEKIPPIPGRLESVQNELGIHVLIDYAHTGESLTNVLKALREVNKGKILVVFGAGGGRDPARRAGMGAAADAGADIAIVTSDNARNEDPIQICSQILEGFKDQTKVLIEIDRKEAIGKAIQLANRGDVVLIAGKGHERKQIFAHQSIPFDDVFMAKQALQMRQGSAILDKGARGS